MNHMRSIFGNLATAAVCILLLLPSGCRIPGLCCPDPPPAFPDTFSGVTTAENSAQTGIVEFFNDPPLTRLLIQGLVQNQELKIRNQEIWIAGNEVMASRGAYLPFLGGSFRGGFERNSRFTPLGAAEDQLTFPGGGSFPDPLGDVRLTTDLFWQIDIWRQLRNARDAAINRYIEAIEDRNYLITRLVAEIAENYYELASLDQRLAFFNQTIQLLEQSLEVARAQKAAARGTELGVQRFLAEVRKNQSQRFIIQQRIIEVENRINFLVGRFPQPVEHTSWNAINLDARILYVGVPAQLLENRRDVRAAERELAAAGLDILVARARFYPRLIITAGVGYEAFSPKYLFDPGAFIANAAGELTAPLVNRLAIRADYQSANARQLQAVYNYQRTVLNAYIEVVNSMNKARNYGLSVGIKQEQVKALEESVNVARDLFNRPIVEAFARVEYVDVLLATRDLLEARSVLIETRQQQLSAIVRTYQALGGGYLVSNTGPEFPELFCTPANIQLPDVTLPPASNQGATPPPGPEILPPPQESNPNR
jgi:NodT family efflux transporter outer membrane factor (OMF) lipoprotein